jgi:hypothetical protein
MHGNENLGLRGYGITQRMLYPDSAICWIINAGWGKNDANLQMLDAQVNAGGPG